MARDASFLKWLNRAGRARLLSVACGLVCACASSRAPDQADAECTYGPQCEEETATKDRYDSGVSLPSASDGSATERNAMCGDDSTGCDPDDSAACSNTADGSTHGEAGQGGSELLDAGVSMSCQVHAGPAGQLAKCALAGPGTSGSPCLSGADCASGYACVEAAGTGQCRRFCCGDPESCETGTHCAERVLRLSDVALSPVKVPVCVTPAACRLDEPYPCLNGATCLCQTGTACAVVRADGTTDCVPPGEGVEGESCPCAAGHICSQGTSTCLKICKLNVEEEQCAQGMCQASKSLPQGYGLCVGDTADAG